ncbi:hypothetical protein FOZ63_006338, partial [Perkinsus olseni]
KGDSELAAADGHLGWLQVVLDATPKMPSFESALDLSTLCSELPVRNSKDDEPVRPTGFQQKPLRTFARLRPLHLPAERGLRSRPKGFCYEVISKDNNLAASVTPQHSGYRGVGAMLRMKCED